jgi:1-aminocyclopropane-1-carboxylate synthase
MDSGKLLSERLGTRSWSLTITFTFRFVVRLGALVSQHNPRIFRTLAPMSMQLKVSSPADVVFSTLLNSDYLSTFLETNRQRLGEAQAFVRSWFEERGVMVRPCHAGHFVWIDMGTRLSILDTAEEMAIFQRSLDGGVYIVSGNAMRSNHPGTHRR